MNKSTIYSAFTSMITARTRWASRKSLAFLLCLFVGLSFTAIISAQKISKGSGAAPAAKKSVDPKSTKSADKSDKEDKEEAAEEAERAQSREGIGEMVGTPQYGAMGIQKTSAEIMDLQAATPPRKFNPRELMRELEGPDRENLPQPPGAIDSPQWPLADKSAPEGAPLPSGPQTPSTSFDGATGPTETGAFPPDTMGAVGPTQFVVFLNGRVRTFNKDTGVADGVINADSDVFFATVITPAGAGEVSFTSDPNVRYDRLSGRWFLTIIDVTLNTTTGAVTKTNRILFAVSNSGVLTGATVWTFFQFQSGATDFADYPSLGIDADALYIGTDQFTLPGSFVNTNAYVIRKSSILGAGPIVFTTFANLIVSVTGPFAPRGVDNYDPTNTGPTAVGYFVGVDNGVFSQLDFRRITNPGGTPTISANITLTVTATQFPVKVPHLGNTGGTNGRLDALDDRLYAAHLRNGRLWTAHNIGVNVSGTTTAPRNRNGARWYEIQNLGTTPTVLQSGTLFDNNPTVDSNQRNYWIPSIMVSGQGHAALGCSIAGTSERANAFTTGRLAGDTLGMLRDGPGGAALLGYTASSTAYNPPSDPGGGGGRRWGDYSYTSLDPCDDMTMWTIQEYCNGTNTYGVRAVKLLAPPPATPSMSAPFAVPQNETSFNITITGTVVSGSGFYDPGAGFNCRIGATITGGVIVNSVTYNSPTSVTLNLNTTAASTGLQNVTVTNPDGQSRTGNDLIIVTVPTAVKLDSAKATGYDDGRVAVEWQTAHEVLNLGFNLYREQNGARTRITPQLLAGSALVAGADTALGAGQSYAWLDTPSSGGKGVRYWIEAVDLKGRSDFYGPVDITANQTKSIPEARATFLARLGQHASQLSFGTGSTPLRRAASPAQLSPGLVNLQSTLAAQPAVKLSVKNEAWYRATQPELAAAGLASTVNPRNLQLFVGGVEVPIRVNGEGDGRFDASDSVEFYGLGLDTPSTDTRVYWLIEGASAGKRITTAPSGKSLTTGPSGFDYTVERRDRTIYFASLRNGDRENFFGAIITSASPSDQALTLRQLDRSAGAGAVLEVALQGVTEVQHKVSLQLNGASVGEVNFTGQQQGAVSIPISQSLLKEGDNTVRLQSLGGGTDVSLVDYIRITYRHLYAAENNSLRLTADATQTVTISGFSGSQIRVVDVTDPNAVQELSGTVLNQKGSYSIRVQAQGAGQRVMLAFASDQVRQVASATANEPSSLRQTANAADLLIITPALTASSLDQLKALRQSQKMAVFLAKVEDIYDEFSFGNKSAQALEDFLNYAVTNWKRKPTHVLLAGDASYDPRDYLGYGAADLVPTKLVDTALMETASDDALIDPDGDAIANVAIGRLPFRNQQEASAMVGKIVGYDSSRPGSQVVLVADLNDGMDFAATNATLRSLVPGSLRVETIERGSADDATIRGRIIDAINRGAKIINYTGHGSSNLWRGNILTSGDAEALTNRGQLSLFITMTCLNGYFEDAALDSLAESMLKATQGGAVAVWASTGTTHPGDQWLMNQEAYRRLFSGEGLTLGEATRRAKFAITDPDVRRTWILLGDPTTKLR